MHRLGFLLLWLMQSVELAECRTCELIDVCSDFRGRHLEDWRQMNCIIPRDCEAISIMDVYLGNSGLIRLTEALALLPHAPNLKRLILKGNGIGDEGAAVLADALAKHALPLASLHLWQQDIREGGAKAIADLIRAKPEGPLIEIVLDSNRMGDEGMQRAA